MRSLLLIFILFFVGCKKIDFVAVDLIDETIQILPDNNLTSYLYDFAQDEKLPSPISEHVQKILIEAADQNCSLDKNKNQIYHFLNDLKSYLLYRTQELPDYLICNSSADKIQLYKLNPGETFELTITGVGLDYDNLSPSYINSDQIQIDIPSLYCDQIDQSMILRLGGSNGLPMNESVKSIYLGQHKEWSIPVIHTPLSPYGLTYQVHVEKKGWMSPVGEGQWAGTRGEGLQMEAIKIVLENSKSCVLEYRIKAFGENSTDWMKPDDVAGDTGEAKKIEAIWIQLLNCSDYAVEYQGHIENVGDTEWIRSGNVLGKENSNQRIEAIRIRIVPIDL